MRYLAVVQRKRFLGQQELHLLAKELGEYSWSAAQGELGSEAVNRFSPGTLVIADINGGQIQRLEDAADCLVALLQSFSRFGDSFKTQLEEIESWKQSLIYQSQELSRREAELLVRAQELELQLAQTGSLSPDGSDQPAMFVEPEWLLSREQSVAALEIELTERQLSLEVQLECLREEAAQLQRDREALEVEHSAQTQICLSEQQILQIRAYLSSLYHLSEAGDADDLTEVRIHWQTDWETYCRASEALAAEAAELAEREREHAQARQDLRERRAVSEAAMSAWQSEYAGFTDQQILVAALVEATATMLPAAGPTGENVEQLQRQLRDEQHEYRQRASQVLQQQEELLAQEAHLEALQAQLNEPDGQLDPEAQAELLEEFEFEKQSCTTLRESLSQQQDRLTIEQAKLDRLAGHLRTLGGLDADTCGLPTALERLSEHARTYQKNLRDRRVQLDDERACLLLLEAQLSATDSELGALRAHLSERQRENQQSSSELTARQLDLERRASALEAQRALGQDQARPLLSDLEYLLSSLQAQ